MAIGGIEPGSAAAGMAMSLRDSPLADRPRAALTSVFGAFSASLQLGLPAVLDDLEQQLFRLAEQVRSSDQQKRCFESLREVRKSREQVLPRMLALVENSLARLQEPAEPPAFAVALALQAGDEVNEAGTLADISRKAELRASQALFPLGQRFGVLAGAPAFEAETLPIGPYRICESLRIASATVDLHPDHRELLYRTFERAWVAGLNDLYDESNGLLAQARILPQMPGGKPRARGVPTASPRMEMPRSTAPAPIPTAPPTAVPTPAAAKPAPAAPPPAAQRPAPAPARHDLHDVHHGPPPLFLRDGAPDLTGFSHPLTGWPGIGLPRPGLTAENDTQDLDLFDRLRDLLAARRHAERAAHPGLDLPANTTARAEDVQAVLAIMQNRPAPPLVIGGRLVPRGISHIKQDLLNQLREFTPDGKPPRLTESDADTIELAGLLFEELGKAARADSPAQALLSKLMIPILRVALTDKRFFTRRLHTARQFLSAIAESALSWHSDDAEDRAAADKLAVLAERVSAEYKGNVALFEELLGEYVKHHLTLTRKSEVAERRHVEAAKGREKLDLARREAAAAISSRLKAGEPSALVRTLLEQAWTDVLALTILRQGANSPVYLTRLAVADRLIESLGHEHSARHTAADANEEAFLRHEVEVGLAQVGYHAEDIQLIVGRMFGDDVGHRDGATLSELAMRLKARTRLGAENVTTSSLAAAFAQPKAPGSPLDAREQEICQRLKDLPGGTWMEFVLNAHGEVARRKLAWASIASDRCLVVNQRGGRVDEPTLEFVAREVARGHARVVPAEADGLVDRSLRAVLARLRETAPRLH